MMKCIHPLMFKLNKTHHHEFYSFWREAKSFLFM